MTPTIRRFQKDFRGATVAEFALILPIIGLMLFGIIKFGIVYNNYLALTSSVANAERQFAVGRTTTTPVSSALTIITSGSPTLNSSKLTVNFYIGSTSCSGSMYANASATSADTNCTSSLKSASGSSSQMTASYPCDLSIAGINFGGSNCTLTAQASERVE